MPFSYDLFKNRIRKFILERFPDPETAILDVGPGEGTYSELLSEYRNMDCVEIFAPYVEWHDLKNKYRQVYLMDVMDFPFRSHKYGLVILGDVLEHLRAEDAQELLKRIRENGSDALVAVPYSLEQGSFYGNEYEAHLQPDLTRSVIKRRYPMLRRLFDNEKYGIYFSGSLPFRLRLALFVSRLSGARD